MYVKIVDGAVAQYPYTVGKLRQDNPNTSFPKSVPLTTLANYGVYPVKTKARPAYNESTHGLSRATTPVLEDGQWVISYSTYALSSDEIAARDEEAAYNNRTKRNKLLADSDWTQVNDSPLTNEVKTSWATYRQELRGITDLDGWPNLSDDDWPVAP